MNINLLKRLRRKQREQPADKQRAKPSDKQRAPSKNK